MLERDLPQYGVAADPVFMRRLLTMVAHAQGGLANASSLGAALGVSFQTVQRHLAVLERIFLLRRLPPYFRNVGKRLVKAPKLYLRDTGLLHHLLGIRSHEELESHPVRGASWETFVIEDVLRREAFAHPGSGAFFWRTAAGAEADLVLERGAPGDRDQDRLRRLGPPGARAARRARGHRRRARLDHRSRRGHRSARRAIARAGFAEVVRGVPE